jgi:hypothetical protein
VPVGAAASYDACTRCPVHRPPDNRESEETRSIAHHIRLTTSDGTANETRIVPGLRGGDRLINHARQLAVSWGIANGSKVGTFAVEDLKGKPVGEGTVVVPASVFVPTTFNAPQVETDTR